MTSEEVFQVIIGHAREVVPALGMHSFRHADRLQDLGANSVDRAEILMLVLESLALQIPRIELFGPRNIGELASFLHQKLAPRTLN